MSRAMTAFAAPTALPMAELIARLPSAATIVAMTDDGSDARYARVRDLAAQAAVRVGGTLLFCVVVACDDPPPRARPRLFFPSVDRGVGRPHSGTRSRDLLLEEARAVAAPGLTVGVWLPSRAGPAGVAEAVAATGASLVLAPARARRRQVLDRTLEYIAARVSAPLIAVAADGTCTRVRALGAHVGAWPGQARRPEEAEVLATQTGQVGGRRLPQPRTTTAPLRAVP